MSTRLVRYGLRLLRGRLLALLVVATSAACNALFGVDDLDYDRRGSGGRGGNGAGASAGEAGAVAVGGQGASAGRGTGGEPTGGSGGEAAAGGAGSNVPSGMALRFDGVDDVVAMNQPLGGDFTIELWIRATTSLSGTSYWQGSNLVSADVWDAHDDFVLSVLDGTVAFGVANVAGDVAQARSTAQVTTGQWTHVAAVRHQSTGGISVFVNGMVEQAVGSTAVVQILDDQHTLRVGSSIGGDFAFEGDVDELRLWSVARGADDIAATFATALSGDEDGLVGYWRFDDGSGPVAADSSPNGNDGSLGNGAALAAPTWVAVDQPLPP